MPQRPLDRREWIASALGACGALVSLPAAAARDETFPARVVRLVVPYSVGVGPDVVARSVAAPLAQRWRQPVVVDNKPGASGIVAFGDVRRTPADGHTLFLADSGTLAVNPLPAFLETPSEVKQFNRSLPCGTKLVKIRRGKERKFVIGVFRLTERPGRGSCGEGEGELVAVAFRIYRNHITSWIRADEEVADPTPEPTPAPSVDPNSA